MRFLFRWAFRLFLVVVVVCVALVLLKDSLVKSYTESRLHTETGMEVRIGRCETGLTSPTLTLEDVRIYNPSDLGGSAFLKVPEIHLEWHIPALALRKLHLKLARVHISEINMVSDMQGRTDTLPLISEWEKVTVAKGAAPRPLGLEFVGIDLLNLTLGKIRYSSVKQPNKVSEVQLGLTNEIVKGIKTMTDLNDAVLSALLRKGVTLSNGSNEPQKKPRKNGR
jgi:hypothetical protein